MQTDRPSMDGWWLGDYRIRDCVTVWRVDTSSKQKTNDRRRRMTFALTTITPSTMIAKTRRDQSDATEMPYHIRDAWENFFTSITISAWTLDGRWMTEWYTSWLIGNEGWSSDATEEPDSQWDVREVPSRISASQIWALDGRTIDWMVVVQTSMHGQIVRTNTICPFTQMFPKGSL